MGKTRRARRAFMGFVYDMERLSMEYALRMWSAGSITDVMSGQMSCRNGVRVELPVQANGTEADRAYWFGATCQLADIAKHRTRLNRMLVEMPYMLAARTTHPDIFEAGWNEARAAAVALGVEYYPAAFRQA